MSKRHRRRRFTSYFVLPVYYMHVNVNENNVLKMIYLGTIPWRTSEL